MECLLQKSLKNNFYVKAEDRVYDPRHDLLQKKGGETRDLQYRLDWPIPDHRCPWGCRSC